MVINIGIQLIHLEMLKVELDAVAKMDKNVYPFAILDYGRET